MLIKNRITGTFPCVFHAPDVSPVWDWLVGLFQASGLSQALPDSRLAIVTWNNFKTSPLEECLTARGVPYFALGKEISLWNNLKKFDLTLETIRGLNVDYVMGLDAHDVIVVGQPHEICDRFESMGCDMVLNCESRFYPDYEIPYYLSRKAYQDRLSRSFYRYLNSGAWIGKREYCIEFFSRCQKIRPWELFDCTDKLKIYNCDQSIVHLIFEESNGSCRLDYQCKIFNNIAYAEKKDLEIVEKVL